MTAVTARPLGSEEPPPGIYVSTPVFRYGLKKGMLPPWDDARFRVLRAGGEPVADTPLGDGRAVNGFVVFDISDVRPGTRYDGFLVNGSEKLVLFRSAELYRLAIDDPSYRTLPPLPPADDEA